MHSVHMQANIALCLLWMLPRKFFLPTQKSAILIGELIFQTIIHIGLILRSRYDCLVEFYGTFFLSNMTFLNIFYWL